MSKTKQLKHVPGHKYRICRDCGLDWNVSKNDESGRVYYCPKCRKRRKDNHLSLSRKGILTHER
ncbi:MAG: hypothetical protein II685_06035 [Clostridia bacterium]|nr:hypothetical protein [Clostridia bacterium]